MRKIIIDINNIEAIIFDFDGVLTDNSVLLNYNGEEFVKCNRSDGLGFNALKTINKPTYIISTEKNKAVTARGDKLNIPVIQGIEDKCSALEELCIKNNFSLDKLVYVGNDLNDFKVMKLCGFSVCPSDSHKDIKIIADYVLKTSGGNGVVRELIEDLMGLDLVKILYDTKI